MLHLVAAFSSLKPNRLTSLGLFDWLEASWPLPLFLHVLRPVAFLGLHLSNIYAFLM